MRQRTSVVVCAGDLRKAMQRTVQNAGLTTTALALSGLCLVGSACWLSAFFRGVVDQQGPDLSYIGDLQVLLPDLRASISPSFCPKSSVQS